MTLERLESSASNEFTPEGGAIGRRQNLFRRALFKTVNVGMVGVEDTLAITGKVVGGIGRGVVIGLNNAFQGARGKNIHP